MQYRVPIKNKFEWQKAVLDKDLGTPPTFPSVGDRYIVASGATGDWSGHENDIAEWNGSSWEFTSPLEGMMTYVKDEDKLYQYTTSWGEFPLSSSSSTFIGLTDTPTSYTGQSGKYTRVNTSENAIEFTDKIIVELRTSDPTSPETGRIWLRTDL